MSMTTAPLNDVAKALKVHPRTVLRAYTGDRNAYWYDTEEYNPNLELDAVAAAFGCDLAMLRRVLKGDDEFLTTNEAAERLELKVRTFRWRNYPQSVKMGKVVRYSLAKLIHENFRKWTE